MLSTFRYATPMLGDSTRLQLQSLQTLLMKQTRSILGFKSFKWSTLKILNTLKWPTIQQLIISETIRFIHKPIYEDTPKAITNIFNISLKRSNLARSNRVPKMKILNKSDFSIKSVLHKATYIYSILPDSI